MTDAAILESIPHRPPFLFVDEIVEVLSIAKPGEYDDLHAGRTIERIELRCDLVRIPCPCLIVVREDDDLAPAQTGPIGRRRRV